jgi:hypothetical protein
MSRRELKELNVYNHWVAGTWNPSDPGESPRRPAFRLNTEIEHPSRTPLFADGVHWWWWFIHRVWGPRATDLPAVNLATGDLRGPTYGMGAFTIPRHG